MKGTFSSKTKKKGEKGPPVLIPANPLPQLKKVTICWWIGDNPQGIKVGSHLHAKFISSFVNIWCGITHDSAVLFNWIGYAMPCIFSTAVNYISWVMWPLEFRYGVTVRLCDFRNPQWSFWFTLLHNHTRNDTLLSVAV